MKYAQETYTGADCSGSNGTANRVLTLSNNATTIQAGFSVYVGGLYLTETTEYTVTHKSSGTTITFLNKLWNDMSIIVDYFKTFTDLYAGMRTDFQDIVLEHGKSATLARIAETTDTMGGVSDMTPSTYTIYWKVEGITEKDRQIHEMGLAIPGNMKAYFYHQYLDVITGNGTLTVQVGDMITDGDGYIWRVEQILNERTADANEIFRVGVVKKISLDQ